MYDTLRPVIIHINHLETLTDLCAVLKVREERGLNHVELYFNEWEGRGIEVLREREREGDVFFILFFQVEMIEEIVEPKGDQLERFGLIIKGLLGDIQQRLVFRAQV